MYCCTDYNYGFALDEALQEEEQKPNVENLDIINGEHLDSHNTTSSPDTCGAGDGFSSGGPTVAPPCRRKRRRTKSLKNKEEMENQRMTHIAVERNRRRQMNDYLAVLRSLMPPSYAQRGDQASIVGGAINFVKELEQLLQFLEAHKLTNNQNDENQQNNAISKMFSNFFTFPQYSMSPTANSPTTTRPPRTRGGEAVERGGDRGDDDGEPCKHQNTIKKTAKTAHENGGLVAIYLPYYSTP
ncbi:hypothetical protein DH2020_046246 [Rehmannia glutinosa]|uniref:BHLH domain-containing protein n=1 Tax=Rehmannia glutinosa TaxID=99300 RepID=A0ABR0UC03_REHGL